MAGIVGNGRPPRHGVASTYGHHKCRCDLCYEAVRKKNAARRAEGRQLLNELKDVPCMDCGGRFPPECMDFDHRDPTQKAFGIGGSVGLAPARLRAEAAKCDVVCANCHRIRTTAQRAAGLINKVERDKWWDTEDPAELAKLRVLSVQEGLF